MTWRNTNRCTERANTFPTDKDYWYLSASVTECTKPRRKTAPKYHQDPDPFLTKFPEPLDATEHCYLGNEVFLFYPPGLYFALVFHLNFNCAIDVKLRKVVEMCHV